MGDATRESIEESLKTSLQELCECGGKDSPYVSDHLESCPYVAACWDALDRYPIGIPRRPRGCGPLD